MDTPRIRGSRLSKGDVDILKEAMEQGVQEGCQTFDQALFALYHEGKVQLWTRRSLTPIAPIICA